MNKLNIHPDEAEKAITLLEEFVSERSALLEDKTQFNAVAAIKMMHALNEFKEKLAVLKSSENRMNGARTSWEKALANIKAQEDDSKEGLLHLNIKTQNNTTQNQLCQHC